MRYGMEELYPLVATLSEQYTGFESTSVTYEQAQRLMGAVCYCIHEYETSGTDSLAAPDMPAQEAYRQGRRLVLEKAEKARSCYNTITKFFCPYGNICLQDTINAIPEFFKWYDVTFAPQDTILSLDYPVLADLGGYSGVDAIERYLECIYLEQVFLAGIHEGYIQNVLEAYCLDYEEIIENICGIVLLDLIKHVFLGKPLDGAALTAQECKAFQETAGRYPAKDMGQKLEAILKELTGACQEEGGRIFAYFQAGLRYFWQPPLASVTISQLDMPSHTVG
ncbi:DUF6179 domain-containing protein [Lachnospiraceae bacterium 29-84]